MTRRAGTSPLRRLHHPRIVILVLVALFMVGACGFGPTATASPTAAAATATCRPIAIADPSATPWNGGTAQPGGVGGPCPSGSATAAQPTPSGTAGSASAEPSPSFGRPTATPEPTFFVHTVKRGDNLTSIARTYSTTPRSIAYWNRDTYPTLDPDSPNYQPNHLEVGWKLRMIPGVTLDDQGPLPTRKPTPLPSVSIPPPPSVAPGTQSVVVSNGSRGTHHVALTFDMGGELGPAIDIVQWLIDNDVRATFFPTGKTASEEAVGVEVMQALAAHPDLFVVGNHSWDHPNFAELDSAAIRDQLDRTEQVIFGFTGRSSRPFFRPPFGVQNAAVRTAVGEAGWAYTVMWDIDTIDWKPTSDGGPTADDIVAKVVSRAQGGSIVLMHLGGYHTLDALPRMLQGLRDKGLEPVTLTEMLGL